MDNWFWGFGETILLKEPVLVVLPKPLLTEFSIYHKFGKKGINLEHTKNQTIEISFLTITRTHIFFGDFWLHLTCQYPPIPCHFERERPRKENSHPKLNKTTY